MLPLVLPEIIVAVALLIMLVQLGLPLSLWTVVAGHVLICTPFSIAILSFQDERFIFPGGFAPHQRPGLTRTVF